MSTEYSRKHGKCRHTCSRVCRACRAVCYGRRAKQYQPSMSLEHGVPSASTLRGTSKQCKSRFAKVGTALCLTQPDNHEAPFDACSKSPGLGLISMRSCPYSLCGLCVWHPLVMGVTLMSRLVIFFSVEELFITHTCTGKERNHKCQTNESLWF